MASTKFCDDCAQYNKITAAAKAYIEMMGNYPDSIVVEALNNAVIAARADYIAHLYNHSKAELIEKLVR